MNGFVFRLVLTQRNSEMAYWMNVEKVNELKKKSEIQENKNLLVKCDAEVLMQRFFRWLNSFSSKITL